MDRELLKLVTDLIEIKAKYDVLIDYLINNSDLNYSGTELRINNVEEIVKTLELEKYEKRFNTLKREKMEAETE